MHSVYLCGITLRSYVHWHYFCACCIDSVLPFQVVQLTSLRPTADLFCSLLRDALKAELSRGQMKAVKSFIQTCYSETLLANAEGDDKDGGVQKIESTSAESLNLGGLGLRFKYPGDPRKYVSETLI